MVEQERGCGWRKFGKLYLVGTGIPYQCDNLPYPLDECECCGYAPQFSRNLQWIKKSYIGRSHYSKEGHCSCINDCPICYPDSNDLEKYALMFVGERYYSPESFTLEAEKMGVSKAIPQIPKDLVLGKTWVFLAHKKVKFYGKMDEESGMALEMPEEKPAIFYGFIPQRIEQLILKSNASQEKLDEMRKNGITPVIIEDEDAERHRRKRKDDE